LNTAIQGALAIPSKFPTEDEYYQKGKQALEQGKVKKTLEIWADAKEHLETPSTRIGVAYVELVAETYLEDLYEQGSSMYYWGLSAREVTPNKDALSQMVKRVGLLVDSKIEKQWVKLLENNDPSVYAALRGFWTTHDLTPTTEYNERLIEHWQRIAYSRLHFNKGNKTFLGADERGNIYVRYGEPDYIRSGKLSFNVAMAEGVVSQVANGTLLLSQLNGQQGFERQDLINLFAEASRNYHKSPAYEIWVYRRSRGPQDDLIYIFGNAGVSTGGFHLVRTIEDFIPPTAYKRGDSIYRVYGREMPNSLSLQTLSPATVLQYMYYDQLVGIDDYFGEMLRTLDLNLFTIGSVDPGQAYSMRNKARADIEIPKLKAPKEASTDFEKLADIPLKAFNYRFLNAAGDPMLITFIESNPARAFLLDFYNNYGSPMVDSANVKKAAQNYRFYHAMKLYNGEGNAVTQAISTPPLETQESSVSQSILAVPVYQDGAEMAFSAKLENRDPGSSRTIKGLPFPEAVRGLGTMRIKQPDPLSRVGLQMSDLVVGFGFQEEAHPGVMFPFTVANDRRIPTDEDLVLHTEVYNLEPDKDKRGRLQLNYRVEPKEGFLGWLKKDDPLLQISVNAETQTGHYIKNLQITTRKLEPGDYKLILEAVDKSSGQRTERDFEFEVVEKRTS